MKKKIVAVIFAVIILSMTLVACGNNGDVPKGMKVASDDSNGFYIMYVPENWLVTETGSNVTLAQSQEKELKTNKLAAVTVNSMFWQMDAETVKKTAEEKYASFFATYNEQIKNTFGEERFHPQGEPAASAYYEGAQEFTYIAKYDDIYYKYVVTIIVHNQMYYAITFNFPQSNLEVDKDGNLTPTESYDKAEFDYVKNYSDSVSDIVSNFKPLK